MTQTNPTDAVAQARDAMVSLLRRYAEIEHPHHDHPAIARKFECDVASDVEDLDALIAAVRAECVREVATLRKEADDLSEANWIMQKRLAMAEAEIVRLGGGG